MLAWREAPADPDRPRVTNPHVQRLAAEIAPNAEVTDLGGTFSLNAKLGSAGLVLRVHQPFMTRRRLHAQQEIRRHLDNRGLVVPVPLPWHGTTLLRCGNRWAELEPYIPNAQPKPTPASCLWLFDALGTIHRALAGTGVTVPRTYFATYGPPSSLLRWLPVTEAAVWGDPEAEEIVRRIRTLVRQLRAQWIPATELPTQLVHGDLRFGNVSVTPENTTAYFDFGFLAHRPRIHDLAYALAWIVLGPDNQCTGEDFAWERVPAWIAAYEAAAGSPLSTLERKALAPYAAAVPLYQNIIAGWTANPTAHLREGLRRPFLRIAEWFLTHPSILQR
jgi:Ser/Thr protein kinase RdoA (MazF antagonist)